MAIRKLEKAMGKDISLIIKLELLWWIVTGILLVVVLYPIYSSASIYPFWISNITYILVFITLVRYIFMLKHTPIRYLQWFKVVAIILCIPLGIYLVQELHNFQVFADEVGVQSLFLGLPEIEQSKMIEYTKTEMLFFGVGSLLATIIFPFRMLVSFWRTYNLGTT